LATAPHSRLRVLFVDDEPNLGQIMQHELPRHGCDVTVCTDPNAAIDALKRWSFDAAVLDIKMHGDDRAGIKVLGFLKQVAPDTEVVMLTGYASERTMVEAMRLGACDYLRKPCNFAEIEAVLIRIREKRKLKQSAMALQTRVAAAEGPSLLVGTSPAMVPVQRLLDTVAPTDATVLITGETGTGKEMVARTLFLKSRRGEMPFVPVNCGALSPTLVESQLFGHRKGAFTGADKDHKGLFEVANGGTLFLDELGELDRNIQVKLLRFLESGEIRPIGANEPTIVDVRVVCATNRDLPQMIAAGDFREDLLYRLNTFEVRLPPLRDRKPDIPELARHLLARAAKRPVEQVGHLLQPDAIEAMFQYDWPGNVREVANAMEYAYIVSGGQPITEAHLPQNVRNRQPRAFSGQRSAVSQPPVVLPHPQLAAGYPPVAHAPGSPSPARTLADIEMEHILRAYEKNGRNKQATAAELGISLKTLYNKLNRYEEERRQAG
jgi:DNA-binding NtrC family response regulator